MLNALLRRGDEFAQLKSGRAYPVPAIGAVIAHVIALAEMQKALVRRAYGVIFIGLRPTVDDGYRQKKRSAGAENTEHFGKRTGVIHMFQNVGAEDCIHGAIGQADMLDIEVEIDILHVKIGTLILFEPALQAFA